MNAELSRLTTVTTRGAERVAAHTRQPSALESFVLWVSPSPLARTRARCVWPRVRNSRAAHRKSVTAG